MTPLKWIVSEAKKLKKQYPKRFAKWTDYVAQASAIYASKHKGKSPIGKKKKVGYSKQRLDVVYRATPFIKKYKEKGFTKAEALKNANLDAAFMGSPKKKAAKKAVKKAPARSYGSHHKDTKSHNVNIRVVSGIGDIKKDLQKKIENALKLAATFKSNIEFEKLMSVKDKERKIYWNLKAKESKKKLDIAKKVITKLKKAL